MAATPCTLAPIAIYGGHYWGRAALKYKTKGVTHFINAWNWSLQGLVAAFKYEAGFRHQLGISLILVPLAFWFDVSAAERAILLASLVFVYVTELLNSAVEATVDRISTEHHELSGRAKDLGSAAVFVAMVQVPLLWAVILLG